jgi:DNA-binding response OmpR family regulator
MAEPGTGTSSLGLIAVVDDDPSMRDLFNRSLSRAGYTVTLARDGAEAIETVSREAVDLVLLDLGLPDFSGINVLRQIRGARDVPVIVVSGHDEEVVRLRCFDEGADDYVVKPCSPREIIARVAAVLRRSRPEAQELCFGDMEVDVKSRDVRVRGRPVELTAREFDL